jgi:deoxycytidylate deaminase
MAHSLKEILSNLESYTSNSHCNRQKMSAALVFTDKIYYGANGDPENSCLDRPCSRPKMTADKGLDYMICYSDCAEGSAMIAAYNDNRHINRAALVSQYFPCERCTSLILYFGIKQVVFRQFQHPERFMEKLFAHALMESGVQVMIADGAGELKTSPSIEGISMSLMLYNLKNAGSLFWKQISDKKYQQKMREECQKSLPEIQRMADEELKRPSIFEKRFPGLTCRFEESDPI